MNLPLQAVPLSEKDEKWKKSTVKAIIDQTSFGYSYVGLSDVATPFFDDNNVRYMIASMYRLYNGILDKQEYSHVTNPYNSTQNRNFPAKLKNFNIVKPIIDLLLGEFIKRPISYMVNVENEDVVTQRSKEIQSQLVNNLYQHFINDLAKNGVDVPPEEVNENVPSPEEVIQLALSSYRDGRAISGQAALNYVYAHQKVKQKLTDGFFDWLIAGLVFSHIRVVEDEVLYDIVNPLEIDYDKSPDTKYIEDGSWVVRRRMMSFSDVVDEFGRSLSTQEIQRLERLSGQNSTSGLPINYTNDGIIDENIRTSDLIDVYQVYWKSKKRIGFVTEMTEEGVEYEYTVSEEEGKGLENVNWEWVNEVWEGVQIGNDIYVNIQPSPIQRNSLNNESICKLPINGIRCSDRNSPNISFMMHLAIYQHTYNIYSYRLENAVAKSKDMIAMIDINLKPENWDLEKWLYYAESSGYMFVNYAKDELVLNPTHKSVLDLTAKSIQQYVQLLEFITIQVSELTGISRQRKGAVGQFDLKGVVEQSIIQSSHITEYLFDTYFRFVQSSLEGILENAKIAFIENKAGAYVMPDGSQEYFSIDGLEFAEVDYGISITVNAKEVQQLNEAKQLSQAFVQNGAPMETVIDMLTADNLSELKQRLQVAENANKAQEQAMQQLQMEIQAEANKIKQAEIDQKREEAILDNQTKLEIAMLQQQSRFLDENDNGINDANEVLAQTLEDERRIALDRSKLQQKDKIDTKQLALQKQMHEDKMQLEKRKLNSRTS